jgi:hypothetical protein
MAISSYHQALSLDPSMTFCADMLNRAMEDASFYPTVRGADPADEAQRYSNFTRLSNYHLGADPVMSGELDHQAEEANKSFGGDRSVNMTAFSGFPSEMRSPGFSMAQSFSQIEGRLSTSARWDALGGGGGGLSMHSGAGGADGSFVSQGSYQSDHGGFLEDSFES